MNRVLLTASAIIFSSPIFAQQTSFVVGKIVTGADQKGVSQVNVTILELKVLQLTDEEGGFTFTQVPFGHYTLVVSAGYLDNDTVQIVVNKEQIDLGEINVQINNAVTSINSQQIATVALEDNASSADDDGVTNQNISGVLTSSRDPYLNAVSYVFSNFRFQMRGYNRDQYDVFINNIPMNDVESGNATWNQWGGLNDVFRNQAVNYGLQPSETGFGGLAGTSIIDATAANQRKQLRISYAASNRTYTNRVMGTYSTGLMANGWAFTLSGSKRWAQNGYIDGTSYDGYSYFVGISRKFSDKSFLHLTSFGSPTKRGKAMPATQEAMDIVGSNFYNPNWGYYDGKKRNARINDVFQPTTIVNYQLIPDEQSEFNIAAAFQTGHVGNSTLDWYNAMDPRPDYYRKLPSYYLYNPNGADTAEYLTQLDYLKANPDKMQVDWNSLYQSNYLNIKTVNGVTGKRSVYIIGQDRDDPNRYSLSTNYKRLLNEHFSFYFGANALLQSTDTYRKLLDLLGGDYYVNLNQFAERTYIGNSSLNQNDLNNPNGIVRVGDKYSYSYNSKFYKAQAWTNLLFTYNKIDLFISGRVGCDAFQRDGQFKNGIFADDSYGKSTTYSFMTYGAKAGATYKINGRNYLYVNGGISTDAPTFENTFVSPRTRNKGIEDPKVSMNKTIDGGYLLRTPKWNGRLSVFATDITNSTNIMRFYHEDYNTFVNYVMQNINVRNTGAEFAVQAQVTPTISARIVATWMQNFYTNRPDVSIYRDNDTTTIVSQEKTYLKNYYTASGPQSVYTAGFSYRSPSYWYFNMNFNYMDRNYMSVNPSRRTESAIGLIPESDPNYHKILDQEKLPTAFTTDIFAGASIKMNKWVKGVSNSTYLYINVGVNNLLNAKVITGAFEQLRFDLQTKNPMRFPPKYFYGYGTNFFVNLSLKF